MAAPLSRACLTRLGTSDLNHSLVRCRFGFRTAGVHLTGTRNRSTKEHEDFFGINEERKEASRGGTGSETKESVVANQRAIETERNKLLQSLQAKRPGKELVWQKEYGQVRLDGTTKKSPQEVNPERFMQAVSQTATEPSTTAVDFQSDCQQQTIPKRKQTKKIRNNHATELLHKKTDKKDTGDYSPQAGPSLNFFDEQYFGSVPETAQGVTNCASEPVTDVEGQPVMPPMGASVDQLNERIALSEPTQEIRSTESSKMDETESHSRPVSGQQRHEADNFMEEAFFPTEATDRPNSYQSLDHSGGSDDRRSCSIRGDNKDSASFIDEQYFPPQFQRNTSSEILQFDLNVNQTGKGNKLSDKKTSQASSAPHSQSGPSFDDHVHDENVDSLDKRKHVFEIPPAGLSDQSKKAMPQVNAESKQQLSADKEFGFVDEQYFESESDIPHSSLENMAVQYGIQSQKATAEQSVPGEDLGVAETDIGIRNNQEISTVATHHRFQIQDDRRTVSRTAEEVEDSAFQAAMKLRRNLRWNLKSEVKDEDRGEGRGRSRVQVLKEQVPDLQHMPALEVSQLLADSIIFENDDFVAVSKPYGLPSHGGPGVRVSVGQVLEPLTRRLDRGRGCLDSLRLVHRLDKETTGVMLLAKNAEVAWQLLGMFRRREVGKVYWTVTKGLPQPRQGVVDIPLSRQLIHGIYKTVVKPREFAANDQVRRRTGRGADDRSLEAVTEYSVLSHRDGMALLECRPLTGVQHQIRAHLSQALNSPVLGDHKYSHMDRLAPQKLFPEALQKLGLRQAQVRHLPMHLHAKQLVLPTWRGRSNVFINAPLPKFFLTNLKTLKIKIPPRN